MLILDYAPARCYACGRHAAHNHHALRSMRVLQCTWAQRAAYLYARPCGRTVYADRVQCSHRSTNRACICVMQYLRAPHCTKPLCFTLLACSVAYASVTRAIKCGYKSRSWPCTGGQHVMCTGKSVCTMEGIGLQGTSFMSYVLLVNNKKRLLLQIFQAERDPYLQPEFQNLDLDSCIL